MPQRLSWSNLVPGVIAFALVLAVAAGVLVFAGVGRIPGKKIKLYVLTDQARGVMRGTDVWLAGQKIGAVDGVEFLPASNDTLGRMVIVVSVRKADATAIRRDSRPQLRPGANIIAPIVVYLTAGTPGSPPVADGDTIRVEGQSDVEAATAKFTAVTADLKPMMADAKTVVSHVRNSSGTVGAILSGESRGQFAQLGARVSRLREKMFGARTSSGPAAVMARARIALARADSVRTLVASSNTSYGRFRRDSTLIGAIAGLRDEMAELRASMDTSQGTLGRSHSDSALTRSLASTRREMTILFDDIHRRPLHYLWF